MSFITMPKEGRATFIANVSFNCTNSDSLLKTIYTLPKENERTYVSGDVEFGAISAKLEEMCCRTLKTGVLEVLANFANFGRVSESLTRVSIRKNEDDGYEVIVSYDVEVVTKPNVYSIGLRCEDLEQFESELVKEFSTSWFSWTFSRVS